MAKRKKKVLQPIEKSDKPAKVKLDSLDVPNHLVPIGNKRSSLDTTKPKGVPTWPMINLVNKLMDARGMSAFVDSRYAPESWLRWDDDHPPTWIDPEILADMAMQDPEIRKILQACWEKKTRKFAKLLPKHLIRVLTEQYVPYVLKQFESAAPLVAEYLTARYANNEIQTEVDKENRRIDRVIGAA